MKFRTLLLSALLTLSAASLRANSVGVNFVQASGTGNISAADLVGASSFAQVNWNNDTGSTANLTDNTGAVTAMGFTTATGISQAHSQTGSPEIAMNRDVLFGIPTSSLTITNIPYATYDIIVYDLGLGNGFSQNVTIGGTSYYTQSPDPNAVGYLGGGTYIYTQGTSTSAGSPTVGADYVLFTDLTGSSQTFSLTGPGASAASSFQVVDTTAVPEPAESATLAAAVIGLITLRRRPA